MPAYEPPSLGSSGWTRDNREVVLAIGRPKHDARRGAGSRPVEEEVGEPTRSETDPVRVLLGQYGRARSPIRAPEGIHYFHVRVTELQREAQPAGIYVLREDRLGN